MKIGSAVRAVREPKKIIKKMKKRTRTLYFTCSWKRNPYRWNDETWHICRCPGRNEPCQFSYPCDEYFASWHWVKNGVFPLHCIWLLQHCLALPRWQVIIGFTCHQYTFYLWWHSIAVQRWFRSTKLSYIEPGSRWMGDRPGIVKPHSPTQASILSRSVNE
jgi:hypothetical protein